MQKLLRIALMLFLMLAGLWTSAQNYSIQKWYNGKSSATVLTFDDWSPGQGPIGAAGLASRGLVGSFYITIANVNDWQPIRNVVQAGNEIGNHTRTHPYLSTVSATQLIDEVTTARTVIESNLPGVKIQTLVYPHGDYNDAVITETKKNHFSARGFIEPVPANLQFPYNFAASEKDYFTLNTVPVDVNMTPTVFGNWVQQAINSHGLLTFTIHSINNATVNDTWWDPITETQYLSLLDKLVTYQSQTWVTTYGNAVRYHKEANSASLTTVSNNSDLWVLTLTDTLSNNSIFNHPLSVKLKKVAGETYSGVSQNGVALPFSFTAGNDSIIFNAVPDGGNISINKNGISVAITSPGNNTTFTGLNSVPLAATASAVGTTLTNVTFSVNGQNFVVASSPYNASWTPTAYGTYTITATANGANGKSSAASVTVTIAQQPVCTDPTWTSTGTYTQGMKVSYNGRTYTANWWNQNANPSTHSGSGQEWTDNGACGGSTNVSPTVSITSPTNGTSYTAPASVTINANASDSDGSISKVEFYNGTTLLGTDNTSPYSYSWTSVAAGTYSLTAKAYDNLNATTTSAVVSITVNTASNVAPTVSISSPTNGATFTAPASVTINANASDSDGSISKVEFYNGTTLLGSDNTSPYSFSWTSVAAGTYSLTAEAYDNLNATATSATVSITVNSASNVPPTVSISSPTNGTTYTAPASVTINANASDSDGSISKVEFYNGTTLLGTDNTSPYSYSWASVAAGTYTLTAKAYDNVNATTTSSAVSITVNSGSGCSAPQYVENGGYVAGSRVKNNGIQYECKAYPYTAWCNGAAWAYAPGTGSSWADAWTQVGACRMGKFAAEETAAALNLYPNPASQNVNVNYAAQNSGEIIVTIVNDMSRTVLTKTVNIVSGDNYIDLNIDELSSGVYLLRIEDHGVIITKKLSIIK